MTFAPSPDPAPPTTNGKSPPRAATNNRANQVVGGGRIKALHADLAQWLLAAEADGPGVAAAAERVCAKLSERLSTLVSSAGAQAILSRALHLARAEFPFLEGVLAGRPPAACLDGLAERVQHVEADEASNGLISVLGAVIDLLVGFIGLDLTLRLLQEVWPELPVAESSQPGGTDGRETGS